MTTTAGHVGQTPAASDLSASGPPMIVRFDDGGAEQADLLGGKGANLCEMTRLGLPVPAGFVITTDVCRHFMVAGRLPTGLLQQVHDELATVERAQGLRFGDAQAPLLVSVRSGARFSMPGMMETVLDVGLTDESVAGLARTHGDRFAWDCYARLVAMYGRTVLNVDGERLAAAAAEVCRTHGVDHESDLTTAGLRELVAARRAALVAACGLDLPQDPYEQLDTSILAVLRSWNSPRARLYRSKEGIDDSLGTAVNVMAMVFGNAGADSGSGVCFTRNPTTGARAAYGNYLPAAQGEDVVSGSRDALDLAHLATALPDVHAELLTHLLTLEHHYRDLCDVEFTVERGRLWMLQTRVGKRTPAAAFRIARDLADERVITLDEALVRVSGRQLETLLNPTFRGSADHELLARGHGVSAGAAVGEVALDSETAVRLAEAGHRVVLVRTETSPDDLAGMLAAEAIVTARGGVTSHAAVVARGMGRPCVVGTAMLVDLDGRLVTCPDGAVVHEGEVISVDGATGDVFRGELDVQPSAVADGLEAGAPSDEVTSAVLTMLGHADRRRRLQVYANADNGPDAERARRLGAQGIGLCRTEHMLLGERRKIVEDIVLDVGRDAALDELERVQREEMRDVLRCMDGLPVVIRLLDPPLHEFLPDLVALSVQHARDEVTGTVPDGQQELLVALRRWSERNPMLGLRGVRLGILMPEIFRAQVRALAEAAMDLRTDGYDPQPHLMVPLVADAAELTATSALVAEAVDQVRQRRGEPVPAIELGAMIELPRAALTAGRLAPQVAFFSFGTNDLTQTTWGLSRDDAESSFLPVYRSEGLLREDPFATIDADGVGRLVSIAIQEGRAARPDLGLGVCGEQGGDPASVHVFHDLGLDYVSCSVPRLSTARLEAGRAAVLHHTTGSDSR